MISRYEARAVRHWSSISSVQSSPPLTLVVQGYIIRNVSWRWVVWIAMRFMGVSWILLIVSIPETRHEVFNTDTSLQIYVDRTFTRSSSNERRRNFANRSRTKVITPASHTKTWTRRILSSNCSKLPSRAPTQFLVTEPITVYTALYQGVLFAIVCGF